MNIGDVVAITWEDPTFHFESADLEDPTPLSAVTTYGIITWIDDKTVVVTDEIVRCMDDMRLRGRTVILRSIIISVETFTRHAL